MSLKLITFDEIHSRAEINIIGGILEVPCGDKIVRGTIDDIHWWRPGHPRQFDWTDGMQWNPRFATWDTFGNGQLSIDFLSREYFGGPYQMDSGEIFFIPKGIAYATIFPQRFEPPEVPYDWRHVVHLHHRFLELEPPGRTGYEP